MSELISKSEVSPAVENNVSNRGFDPDCRVVEKSTDVERPSIGQDAHKIDPDARVGQPSVAFKGLTHVESISDIQKGGTCWAESIENIIQLMRGDQMGDMNDLSDRIIEKVASEPEKWDAIKHPEASEFRDRWNIPTYKYEAMLGEFGVDAKTMRFSHAELQSALKENRPVILVGDVKALKEQYGGQSGGHALVAIDWEPDAGKYVLLDSNSKEVYRVAPKRLEGFIKGTFSDKINNFLCGNMTVTQTPARWSSWKVFVDGKWKMYVDGREIKNPLDDFAEFTRKGKNETVAFRGNISEIELTKMKYAVEKLGREIEEAHRAGKKDLEYKLKQERDSLKLDIAKYVASNGYNGDAYRSATRINYR